jgi:purine-binding chemotaxis protein CheW
MTMDEQANNKDSATRGMYLTFVVDQDDYALEIDYVTEIIQMQAITDMPELPPYIKGVINLRSKIVPVMDIRTRFGKEERIPDDRTCIVVVDVDGADIGMIIDTVRETMHIEEENIAPPSQARRGMDNKYIKGVCKTELGTKLLIDLERVVAASL